MKTQFYRCDAFTTEPGKGNPAGVVPDAQSLSDEQMQKIAAWAGYSETAFVLPSEKADLQLVPAEADNRMPLHTPCMCADAMTDQMGLADLAVPEYIETPFFTVRTDQARGVSSIVYRPAGRELVDPASPYGAFTCLYEVTPAAGPQYGSTDFLPIE